MASYKVRLAVLGVAAAVLVAPVFSQKPIRMPRIELKEPNKESRDLKTQDPYDMRALEEEVRSRSRVPPDPTTGRILVPGRVTVLQRDSYFRESEAAILDELSKGGTTLQSKQIEDAIKSKIAAAATERAHSDPNVSFEVLTGKLSIKKPIIKRNEAPSAGS